jgi:cytochrome c oxidase subunit 2
MRIRVIAQSDAEFNQWVSEQTKGPLPPDSQEAIHGLQLFQQLTCANCHAVGDSGTRQRIAPDLTHLASRQTLAAGALDNTANNLSGWLHDPGQFKPESHMPNLQLKPDDIGALTAYLETLR